MTFSTRALVVSVFIKTKATSIQITTQLVVLNSIFRLLPTPQHRLLPSPKHTHKNIDEGLVLHMDRSAVGMFLSRINGSQFNEVINPRAAN